MHKSILSNFRTFFLIIILVFIFCNFCQADVCPNNVSCNGRCCVNQNNDYYCCPIYDQDQGQGVYLVGVSHWWKDYWGVVIGCIIGSIIISVILSVLCCLFCNGCWWHRRRNGGVYGGGFPLGTILYSPHIPPWYDQGQPTDRNGHLQQQHRVRFTDDELSSNGSRSMTYEAPKSAMKNKSAPPNGTLHML